MPILGGGLKVFVSNDFKGFYPVGTSAVIVAESYEQARELLIAEMQAKGLKDSVHLFTLVEVDANNSHAIILQDGNY